MEENNVALTTDLVTHEHSMTYPGSWIENSVLTISLNDDRNPEQNDNTIDQYVFMKICQHFLLIATLTTSAVLIVVSASLLHYFHQNEVSLTGGICCLISIHTVFRLSGKHPGCHKKYYKKVEKIKQLFRKFILKDVFQEQFLNRYLIRAQSLSDLDKSQFMVSFVESSHLDNWVKSKWETIKESPEGLIIDSIGLNSNEVENYFKAIVHEVLYEYHERYCTSEDYKDQFDAHTFRKHISNILTEQLHNLYDKYIHDLKSEIVMLYMDDIVITTCISMGLFGAFVGGVTELL